MSKNVGGLHPRMPFCEAARPVIGSKLDDLSKHEAGTRSGEDIEALHDMRVASRRLREAMNVFAVCFPKRAYRPLQKKAAAFTRALGEVRDRDVLIEGLERYQAEAPEEEKPGIADLAATLRDERSTLRAAMISTLDEVDIGSFRRDLEAVLDTHRQARTKDGIRADASLRENAQRICVVRVADFYGLAPAVHHPEQAEELHEMRIAAKHLRYAMEIFRVCFGQDSEERIEEVKSVQEQIGQIHDCDVLVGILRRHLSVVAQRSHEELLAIAEAPLPHQDRMERIRAALDAQHSTDPRVGLLSLLSHKLDERHRRYADFVRWWDAHERDGMRGKLYACITAYQDLEVSA